MTKYFICKTLKALISIPICEKNQVKDPDKYEIANTCNRCQSNEYFQEITYSLEDIINNQVQL